MTRVNLVPPETLADQHLIAEYREIIRMPEYLERSLRRNGRDLWIPDAYAAGKGHVSFFYDKMYFITMRHYDLVEECQRRGFRTNMRMDVFEHLTDYYGDYQPTPLAMQLNIGRIMERIEGHPDFYRYRGVKQDADFFKNMYMRILNGNFDFSRGTEQA